MMMRVCVLPQEVNGPQTRSKTATAWFADRHMQVLVCKGVKVIVVSNWSL